MGLYKDCIRSRVSYVYVGDVSMSELGFGLWV